MRTEFPGLASNRYGVSGVKIVYKFVTVQPQVGSLPFKPGAEFFFGVRGPFGEVAIEPVVHLPKHVLFPGSFRCLGSQQGFIVDRDKWIMSIDNLKIFREIGFELR